MIEKSSVIAISDDAGPCGIILEKSQLSLTQEGTVCSIRFIRIDNNSHKVLLELDDRFSIPTDLHIHI